MFRRTSQLRPAYSHLPLRDADTAVLGRKVPFFQDWLEHPLAGDPWWDRADWSARVASAPPVDMHAGWYDLFLPPQLEDYRRLREAGRPVRLSIGPWTHASPKAGASALRSALDHFDRCFAAPEVPPARQSTVRVCVMGEDRWADLEDWPPPNTPSPWYLGPGGSLVPASAPRDGFDGFVYDPADPAPGLGGATLDPLGAGRRDQAGRERRPDVLTYTSEALAAPLTIAGPVLAELWVGSSAPSHDWFVRLCDVHPGGRSYNVCDGIQRVRADPEAADPQPRSAMQHLRIDMWPTAMTFGRGHRLRLQISSAAHPLYARNTGGDEPLATAARLVRSAHKVGYGPSKASRVVLPVSSL